MCNRSVVHYVSPPSDVCVVPFSCPCFLQVTPSRVLLLPLDPLRCLGDGEGAAEGGGAALQHTREGEAEGRGAVMRHSSSELSGLLAGIALQGGSQEEEDEGEAEGAVDGGGVRSKPTGAEGPGSGTGSRPEDTVERPSRQRLQPDSRRHPQASWAPRISSGTCSGKRNCCIMHVW